MPALHEHAAFCTRFPWKAFIPHKRLRSRTSHPAPVSPPRHFASAAREPTPAPPGARGSACARAGASCEIPLSVVTAGQRGDRKRWYMTRHVNVPARRRVALAPARWRRARVPLFLDVIQVEVQVQAARARPVLRGTVALLRRFRRLCLRCVVAVVTVVAVQLLCTGSL